jgi:hypothetical protein
MKALQVNILAGHHAAVDVAQPQRVSDGERKADDGKDDVGRVFVEQQYEKSRKNYRKEHGRQLNNKL